MFSGTLSPTTGRMLLAATLVGAALFPLTALHAESGSDDWGSGPPPQLQAQLRALHWTVGPQNVEMFGNANLAVPKDYLFLGTEDTAKFESLMQQLPGPPQYLFAPKDFHWQVLFEYRDDGYVKDDETIDADAILNNIREGTEKANAERRSRGYDEMEVVGWQIPPHYDPQTHRLEWAIRGRDKKTHEEVENFNTRILGRGGVMSVVLITSPEALTAGVGEFKGTLAGFDYRSGQRYAEYKPGDKIAKYGLAALITGGAAAVAVKTGLWKVILGALVAGWKVIAAACVALFGAISRFFKRKAA